jgi:kynurenine 3-monooxygenase
MTRKLVIVGAGPVGCLAAISLAKMGWSVEIYETRPGNSPFHLSRCPFSLTKSTPDIRLPSSQAAIQQRSINLAISSRGIAAMQAIDSAAASRFLDNVIPMRGRMIHDSDGNLDSQPYDRNGQVGTSLPLLDGPRAHALVPRLSHALNRLVLEKCINSIDRALLNQGLLDEALAVKSVRVFFQHRAVFIDFDGRVISVLDASTGKERETGFDLCIGADGSYSIVRRQLMRVVRWVPLSTSDCALL